MFRLGNKTCRLDLGAQWLDCLHGLRGSSDVEWFELWLVLAAPLIHL